MIEWQVEPGDVLGALHQVQGQLVQAARVHQAVVGQPDHVAVVPDQVVNAVHQEDHQTCRMVSASACEDSAWESARARWTSWRCSWRSSPGVGRTPPGTMSPCLPGLSSDWSLSPHLINYSPSASHVPAKDIARTFNITQSISWHFRQRGHRLKIQTWDQGGKKHIFSWEHRSQYFARDNKIGKGIKSLAKKTLQHESFPVKEILLLVWHEIW